MHYPVVQAVVVVLLRRALSEQASPHQEAPLIVRTLRLAIFGIIHHGTIILVGTTTVEVEATIGGRYEPGFRVCR
jgi:hypothetical protein